MRGGDDRTEGLFSYVSCEVRVPLNHPLRPIRAICDEALGVLSSEFETMYSKAGRPSVGLRKTRHNGTNRVGWVFTLTAAYNLVRLPKLMAAA